MKTSEFKKILKESIKESLEENLPRIMGEYMKENNIPERNNSPETEMVRNQLRENFMSIIGETKASMNTSSFSGIMDPISISSEGGNLPNGEVSLDMIKGLMGK